jgi:hypothetical protein
MTLHKTSKLNDGAKSETWQLTPPSVWPSFGQAGEQLLATQAYSTEVSSPSISTLDATMNPHLSRHRRFYMRAGNLHFLVGRNLFRVHRHFFVSESSYFRELLSAAPGSYAKGSDDSSAIILDDVLPEEFACFLSVFYDPSVFSVSSSRPKGSGYTKITASLSVLTYLSLSLTHSQYTLTSADEWLLILELACHWGFPEVKKTAIRALSTLHVPEVDRIVAFETLKLNKAYLYPLYAALVAREHPLSAEEGEKLGMHTAIRIAQLRETARLNAGRAAALKRTDRPDSAVQSIIQETFDLPEAVQAC